jgi:tRNA threonylcarbamoyladenosine biosynthesis protein TsaB
MAKELTLGLCTSGSRLKLAVEAGGKTRATQLKIYNQERALFGIVRRELGRAGGGLRDVSEICAARGPGRFTGIRIALTLAGTLKALAGARVLTATAFEILARQAFELDPRSRELGLTAVLLHAFKDEYFCQFFRTGAKLKAPRPDGEPVWLKGPELAAKLAGEKRPYLVIGDAEEHAGVYALPPATAPRCRPGLSKVLPAYIIKAARAVGCASLTPLYLKPAKYELLNK